MEIKEKIKDAYITLEIMKDMYMSKISGNKIDLEFQFVPDYSVEGYIKK